MTAALSAVAQRRVSSLSPLLCRQPALVAHAHCSQSRELKQAVMSIQHRL